MSVTSSSELRRSNKLMNLTSTLESLSTNSVSRCMCPVVCPLTSPLQGLKDDVGGSKCHILHISLYYGISRIFMILLNRTT